MEKLKELLKDKELTYNEVKENYCDVLDSTYESVNICGLEYLPSYALKEVDPTAFRCGLLDFIDAEFVELDDKYYLKVDFEKAKNELEREG